MSDYTALKHIFKHLIHIIQCEFFVHYSTTILTVNDACLLGAASTTLEYSYQTFCGNTCCTGLTYTSANLAWAGCSGYTRLHMSDASKRSVPD